MSLRDPLGIGSLRADVGRLAGELETSRAQLTASDEKVRAIRRAASQSIRRARSQIRASALLSAGSIDRLTADWSSSPVNINDIIRRYRQPIVSRSRERYLNDAYGERYVSMVEANVIGSAGITLRSRYGAPGDDQAKVINQKIQDRWQRWCRPENCDLTEQLSFDELQRLFIRGSAVDGENLTHFITLQDRGAPRLAIQFLDSELLDLDYTIRNRGEGGYISMGVECDAYGRPIAYHVRDWNVGAQMAYDYGRKRIRIDARNLRHSFIRDMPGQVRGLPWMTSVLWALRMLGEFENATLVNARYGAENMSLIVPSEDVPDPDAKIGEGEDAAGNRVLPSGPGQLGYLNPGDQLVHTDTRYPDAAVEPFIRQSLRRFSSGTGTSYNMMANDLVGVNFSSIRHGVQDQQELWKGLQAWTIRECPADVFRHWLMIEMGRPDFDIPLAAVPEILERSSWQARTWNYVNPLQDIQAKLLAIANGVDTYGALIRENGREPEDVWREYSENLKAMREHGITPMTAAEIMATLSNLPKEQEVANAAG